jgi:hypothetical protein
MNLPDTEWTCFEDIIFETQYGNWFPATPYMSKWRHSLLESVGILDDNSVPDDGLSKRCLSNQLRIHVFKRTEGRGLREFVNLDEVVALAQSYTSLPIEAITINSTTSVQDQARIFRAFDLLITSHGVRLLILFLRIQSALASSKCCQLCEIERSQTTPEMQGFYLTLQARDTPPFQKTRISTAHALTDQKT